MAITDILAILFLLTLGISGFSEGILRSLIKPSAVLLSLASSFLLYTTTHNFNLTCLASIAGPFVISWLIGKSFKRFLSADPAREISLISRLSGMTVGFIWGSATVALAVAILTFFPFDKFELDHIGKDIRRSQAFQLVRPVLVSKGLLPDITGPTPCLSDACKMDDNDKKNLASDTEMTTLMDEPLMKKLMSDPEAMEALKSQNVARIMANPVINEMKNDPQFLLKVMKLYPKIQQKINAHEK